MKERNLMKISLRTVSNGYTLTVDESEFMYFNEVDLLAGFMAHVGLSETGYMDKGTILNTLFSAMMGSAYADSVTTLKQRVGLLSNQYDTTINRMDKAIEYVTQAEKTIENMMSRLDKIDSTLRATEIDHANNKKVVDEATKKLAEIEKRSNDVHNSISNTQTILKAINESAELAKKSKVSKEDGEPSKSDDGDKKHAKSDKKTAGKTKGARSKNDAAVLNEIEKQANPNLK